MDVAFTVAQAKFDGKWSVCMSSSFFDPSDLAAQLLKPAPKDAQGPMFAYLWRRFGYPVGGWDGYKSLVSYLLTTPDPEIVLWCSPGTTLRYSIGFGVTQALDRQLTQIGFSLHHIRDYDAFLVALADTDVSKRIASALAYTLTDLLRPVYIRDTAINVLGRAEGRRWAKYPEAERYEHAGYGVGLDFDPSKRP